MIFILKALRIKEIIEKAANSRLFNMVCDFVKTNKVNIKFACLAAVCLFSLGMYISANGLAVGFNVKYSGKVIATVKSQKVFDSACEIVESNVAECMSGKSIKSPKFSLTLTTVNELDSAVKLADKIINNTDSIEKCSAIAVDGKVLICGSSEDVKAALDEKLTAFYIEGAENSSSFVESVKVTEGYHIKSEIKSLSKIKEALSGLNVKTTSVVTSQKEITFKTTTVKDSTKTVDYSVITKNGSNGIREIVQTVETVNGAETSRVENSNQVIKEPVDRVITVGTKIPQISASQKAAASSAGFIRPMNAGTYTVTSYYGDGRNHKAMDFGAKKGTPIFAVADGTVTYAGYDSDYGYNLIIQHKNGLSTRYAHAAALCVSKGQTVSQGSMIATVGNSGRSTGAHLHFEVIVNGNRVNPAPYIGF
ncbi:MAG: peptidoglycan DD-metalloendopeptidase family protein [Clostridia bacterium]|nr:peptidoglycan DD-metalloendopeptidase family protein [Clostridia bacterium]